MTPPASAAGGNGLVVNAAYSAPDNASGSVSAEQWVIAQKPLPLPPGATDLALSATASASATSPWTQVSAINNGIYPITSNDDNDLTPYWGDWPASARTGSSLTGRHRSPPTAPRSTGPMTAAACCRPSSWVVQYWDGTTWVDVSDQSGEPVAINAFNSVTFDSVTTSKLRISMQSNGTASVGAIQWVVPSVPSS